MERTRTQWGRRQPLLLRVVCQGVLLCVGFVSSGTSGAASPAKSDSPAINSSAASLHYQEAAYTVAQRSTVLDVQHGSFAREPVLGRGRIIRGSLEFGGGSNAVPFIWQRTEGRLFLDLNRNRDLTDDTRGKFEANTHAGARHQTFTNVQLSFGGPFGNRKALVDLDFWDYGSRPGCTVALHSFWQGMLALRGGMWQAGFLEVFASRSGGVRGDYLLIRPWEEREKSFDLASGDLDAVPFPTRLFIDGQAYGVELNEASENGDLKRELRFTEEHPALGELRINGRYIRRLVLKGEACLVALDRPEPVVKVPVGRYRLLGVELRQGENKAYRDAQFPTWVVVAAKRPTTLTAGGPLTNTVSVSRGGRYLELDYRLIGAEGHPYKLGAQDRLDPPEFAVYRNGRKIASGKFRYG